MTHSKTTSPLLFSKGHTLQSRLTHEHQTMSLRKLTQRADLRSSQLDLYKSAVGWSMGGPNWKFTKVNPMQMTHLTTTSPHLPSKGRTPRSGALQNLYKRCRSCMNTNSLWHSICIIGWRKRPCSRKRSGSKVRCTFRRRDRSCSLLLSPRTRHNLFALFLHWFMYHGKVDFEWI